jgi:beta-phosphoglucomutase-like phosphatase (HAD superfamily)
MTLLIFDCDGVLADSEHIACSGLAKLMTTLGRPMNTEEEAVLVLQGASSSCWPRAPSAKIRQAASSSKI